MRITFLYKAYLTQKHAINLLHALGKKKINENYL
jgi:hypothetical protein